MKTTTILFFSLLLFSCSSAQEDLPHDDEEDNLNISYVILSPLLALFVMGFAGIIFLMGCIFITMKELLRRQITTSLDHQSDSSRRASCVSMCGINVAEIEGFPLFVYSDLKGRQTGDDDQFAMECNICLCEFEDDEMLRLLPICGHMFHQDCINTWLASHVTCPVCRDILLVPCRGHDTNTSPVTVLIHSGHDPVPVSEPCSVISGQT